MSQVREAHRSSHLVSVFALAVVMITCVACGDSPTATSPSIAHPLMSTSPSTGTSLPVNGYGSGKSEEDAACNLLTDQEFATVMGSTDQVLYGDNGSSSNETTCLFHSANPSFALTIILYPYLSISDFEATSFDLSLPAQAPRTDPGIGDRSVGWDLGNTSTIGVQVGTKVAVIQLIANSPTWEQDLSLARLIASRI